MYILYKEQEDRTLRSIIQISTEDDQECLGCKQFYRLVMDSTGSVIMVIYYPFHLYHFSLNFFLC